MDSKSSMKQASKTSFDNT